MVFLPNSEPEDEVVFDRPLSVRLTGVDDCRIDYANLVQINFDRAAFQVVFAQFLQPILSSPEDARELSERGYVSAKVLSRLILTPQMMEETIQVLTRQLENFRNQPGFSSLLVNQQGEDSDDSE